MFSENALRELPPDERDLHLGALVDYPKLDDLPETFYLGDPLEIKNQIADKLDDFCTAYASCTASEYQEGIKLWPAFSFAASKRISGDPKEWGQDLRSMARAHKDYGAVAIQDVAEQDLKLTPEQKRHFENYSLQTVSNAKKHYKNSFVTCKGPYDAYDNIRASLILFKDEKRVPFLGVIWGWSLTDFILKTLFPGYGHSVACVGYDKDGLIIVNSAGLEAGQMGMHRLPRETANAYIPRFGAYMFLDETPDSLRDRLINENNALQILVNFFLNIYGLLKKTAGAIFGSSKA